MPSERLIARAIDLVERGLVPDFVIRAGIRYLLRQRLRAEETAGIDEEAQKARVQAFVENSKEGPIAFQTDKANEQHYEVPAEYFLQSLGPHLKYSCCHWPDGVKSLADAEASALAVTCERAGLADGQKILELGCGWGSLSLWMAEHFPGSSVTAVSNSNSQREFIEARAKERGLKNLQIVTADMNDFQTDESFDRVVSIEMFEHMRNYELLLSRIAGCLVPGGRLFVHIFCHARTPYVFESEGAANWMGRYFFSGGTMPSDDLLSHYQRDLKLIEQWKWNGQHYEKTCNAWLALQDQNWRELSPLFTQTYGKQDAARWFMRWRLFYMSCAELFGFNGGNEWWVSHYLFEKPS